MATEVRTLDRKALKQVRVWVVAGRVTLCGVARKMQNFSMVKVVVRQKKDQKIDFFLIF